MDPLRTLIRLALRLTAVYGERNRNDIQKERAHWRSLEKQFQELLEQRGRMEYAESRGWHHAANALRKQLINMVDASSRVASSLSDSQGAPFPSRPELAHLLAELQQLHAEFEPVILDLRKQVLAVQTESIVLEEVDLGPFSIELHWSRLRHDASSDCFDIVALAPRAAASDTSVTHPHVKNDHLCAGDASQPLSNALEEGRLADAFLLVRSVLGTYNAGSAHAYLEDWEGNPCGNCDALPRGEEFFYCEGCDRDVCPNCVSSCKACDVVYCHGCQSYCAVCDQPCCQSCLTTSSVSHLHACSECLQACPSCGSQVAASELDASTGQCPACQEEAADEDDGLDGAPLPCASSTEGDHR